MQSSAHRKAGFNIGKLKTRAFRKVEKGNNFVSYSLDREKGLFDIRIRFMMICALSCGSIVLVLASQGFSRVMD